VDGKPAPAWAGSDGVHETVEKSRPSLFVGAELGWWQAAVGELDEGVLTVGQEHDLYGRRAWTPSSPSLRPHTPGDAGVRLLALAE
jgi:hypothetical protein